MPLPRTTRERRTASCIFRFRQEGVVVFSRADTYVEHSSPEAGRDASAAASNFIRAIVEDDVRANRYGGRVVTRFPPEPNGYLHIGHAKAIVLNFGIAGDYSGRCNLRFDDTNPTTEDVEYVDSIQRDVRWLGYDWEDRLFYASDYFQQLYDFAEELIRKGVAYVDSQSEDEIRQGRGTVTEPGRLSPYRDRSVEENLDLFERMKAGEFPDGSSEPQAANSTLRSRGCRTMMGRTWSC